METSNAPLILVGNAATTGIGAGKAILLGDHANRSPLPPPRPPTTDATSPTPDYQLHRFQIILEKATHELQALESMALKLGGSSIKEIVHTQSVMLSDPILIQNIIERLQQHEPLEQAIENEFSEQIARMEVTGNAHLLERTTDVRDVRDRLLKQLSLHNEPQRVVGSVLIANEITPTELIEYASSIQGAAMCKGGATSHVAIIAAALEIPLVMGVHDLLREIANGDEVVIDADNHRVILRPGFQIYQDIIDRQRSITTAAEQSWADHTQDVISSKTLCGVSIPVRANVEFEPELDLLNRFTAEGIGLVRTESFWLRSVEAKTLERQRWYYQAIVQASNGHPVTFRLLDIGGDKVLDRNTEETNPYLGWRGARLLLQQPEWIKTQLEAILEVSASYPGVIRIMLPMVTEMDEWLNFKSLYEQVRTDRYHRGLGMDQHIPVGLMVEVPSVTLRAEPFAQVCDFFSIGTNDLTQYILAVDRGNPLVSPIYDGLHPAVLEAIRLTVLAAQNHDIPVIVCGEVAAEPVSAACLLGLGVQELSMSPKSIPGIRDMIQRHSLSLFKELAASFMAADQRSKRKELMQYWAERL